MTISRAEGHSVEFDDLSGTLCAGGYDLAFTTGGVGQEEVTKRMMAHALLFMMPPNGLDEAVESLGEMLEFHRDRMMLLAAPVQQRVIERKAKITALAERTHFVVAD